VRVDTGVRQGDAITPFYDPMIAKLIVRGDTRQEAVARLAAALAHYEVVGVRTNLALLSRIAASAAFRAGELDTGFIARHDMLAEDAEAAVPAVAWLAAACAWLRDRQAAAAAVPQDPWSPWAEGDAWRLNGEGYQDVTLRHGDQARSLRLFPSGDGGVRIAGPEGTVLARMEERAEGATLRLDGVVHRVSVARIPGALVVFAGGQSHAIEAVDPLLPPRGQAMGDARVIAPIPARVTRVLAAVGDSVAKGAPLLVLEAMKMELTLSAPADGKVASIRAAVDDMVQEGSELVTFE
jgi:3-methylcrotonyl-CoA carboxylase alpha subunit